MKSARDRQTRVDLRLVLPAGASWLLVMWVLTAPVGHWLAVVGGLVVVVGLCCWRGCWAGACVLLLIMLALIGGGLRVGQQQRSPLAAVAARGGVVEVEVVTATDVRLVGQPGRQRAVVSAHTRTMEQRGTRHRVRQPVQVSAGQAQLAALQSVPAGATVRVLAKAAPPQPGRSEVAVLRLTSPPEIVHQPNWWSRQVNRVRAGLVASMAWSPPDQAGLAPSLVVGDTSRLLPETEEAFKRTGLTHLTAVSGTNLTLLLSTMLVVSRVAGVRGRWLHLVAVVGVAVFIMVCRAEPSVLRASAMGLVGLAAVGNAADRQRGLRHLSVAVLALMIVDPWLARSWGFALSVTASAGILWWGPPWRRALARWLPGWLADALAVPLAAQLATQPLVTALSGTVSTSGLVANVLAGPFVGPTTVLGLLAAVLSLVWQLPATACGWLAGWSVAPVIAIADWGARMPAATWVWLPGPVGVVLIAALSLAAAAALGWALPRRWASLVLAVLMVASMLRQPPPQGWPGQWDVAFCSVGQGDATVLRVDRRTAILIDTGPDPEPVRKCLDSLGIRQLAVVVLTHHHADHTGGLEGVLGRYRVGLVLVNPYASPIGSAHQVDRLARHHRVAVRAGAVGEQLVAGATVLRVLAAGEVAGSQTSSEGESAAENDSSIVVSAQVGRTSVLLPGDIEPLGQRALLSANPDLRADVWKMPHHGSSRQDVDTWRATGARLAIASAGAKNSYGHPSAAALRLATAMGMRVLRTDDGESFTVQDDGTRLRVRSARLGN